MPDADRLPAVLGKYATELSDASESADSQEVADAYAVLSAIARGESPPDNAARRVVDRAKDRKK